MLNGARFPHFINSRRSVEDLMGWKAVQQQVLVFSRLSSTICASYSTLLSPLTCTKGRELQVTGSLTAQVFHSTDDFTKHC